MSCELFDEACLEFSDQRSEVKAAEKKCTYIAKNKKQLTFCLYRVDDCLLDIGRKEM